MTYIVVVERGAEREAIGPYRSFKKAEGDAKAWDGDGRIAYVVPITKPEAYKPHTRSNGPHEGRAAGFSAERPFDAVVGRHRE